MTAMIDSIAHDVANLQRRVEELSRDKTFSVLITTLVPRQLKLTRDIPVVVTSVGEDFVATFFDAGISSTGDNDVEAVSNLKDLIGQTYEILSKIPESQLGKLPRQQLASLRTFIATGD